MGICLISASGTMGITLHHKLSQNKNIKLECLISCGNMAGLKFNDYLDWAAQEDTIDTILIYMEDVGVNCGKSFINSCLNCNKPMVVLKGGRSSSGAQAAASHTGALAGSDQVYQAAFKQAGVHLVETIEELFMAAEVLSRCKLPKGNRVGVLSPGGGANILCVDQLEKYGFIVPELEEVVQENIKRHLPLHAPQPRNPVDTAASFGFGDYQSILYYMTTSKEIDVLITNFVMTDGFLNDWKRGVIPKSYYTDSRIPIIGSWMGEKGCVKRDFEKLIPIFNEPSKAAWCASLLVQQKKFMEKK